jgi:hypothetical protein
MMGSCNIINPKEASPRFLQIDSITVNSLNTGVTGSNSSKITDAWVYANNDLLGTFELPAKIPILDPTGDVTVIPGIQINGFAGVRGPYQFYKNATIPLDWPLGTIKIFNPKVVYQDKVELLAEEDFETGNSFGPGAGDTTISVITKTTDTNVYEGNKSGHIYLTTTKPRGVGVWETEIDLANNKKYYIELNYKCDVDFEVKVSTLKSSIYNEQSVAGVRAKTTWNKIYLELGSILGIVQGEKYKIIIDSKLTGGKLKGYVYIDNFKIVGFKD